MISVCRRHELYLCFPFVLRWGGGKVELGVEEHFLLPPELSSKKRLTYAVFLGGVL